MQEQLLQLDRIKFFRDVAYVAKVILLVAGAVHKIRNSKNIKVNKKMSVAMTRNIQKETM